MVILKRGSVFRFGQNEQEITRENGKIWEEILFFFDFLGVLPNGACICGRKRNE